YRPGGSSRPRQCYCNRKNRQRQRPRAILQALFSLVSRSLGRMVSAVFGWAVVALFGETSSSKNVWLSGLLAAAAAWPILLIGVAIPKVAALVLAFVPLPGWVPTWTVRAAWIGLAFPPGSAHARAQLSDVGSGRARDRNRDSPALGGLPAESGGAPKVARADGTSRR